MKKILILSLMVIWIFTWCSPRQFHSVEITPLEIQQHVDYLASDKLEGRLAGTAGDQKTTQYIAREFKRSGLFPGGSKGSYFQKFSFTAETIYQPDCRLFVNDIALQLEQDFRPLGFSSSDSLIASVVFIGYGIVADDIPYSDYEDLILTGKIALILETSPDGEDPSSPFATYLNLYQKALRAREKGALAVLFVRGPLIDNNDDLIRFKQDRISGNLGIPVLSIKRAVAQSILSSTGYTLDTLQNQINREQKGLNLSIPEVKVEIITHLEYLKRSSQNVIAFLKNPRTEPLNEAIVIGAHHDHLGWGTFSSLSPDTIAIHNGADDNASGVAGLLELAQKFAAIRDSLHRQIIFIAFGAEELGLIGSSYYIKNPVFALDSTIAMFNLDMIGRMRDSTLIVIGVGSSSIWPELTENLNRNYTFQLKFNQEAFGASDHSPFHRQNIPVLFFFTGIHSDYHKYSDDADKIKSTDEARILNYIFDIASTIAVQPERPDFVRRAPLRRPVTGGRGTRTWVGTIPDFTTEVESGMPISGVIPGGPADQAGLQDGDIIIKFDKIKIMNIQDFMYAIQQHNPGEQVVLVIQREDSLLSKTVTLGSRDNR